MNEWFENCGGFNPSHKLDQLRTGIDSGLLNVQDEYGMTGLSLAVASNWLEGVEALLLAGADTELRYFRTGETALLIAMTYENQAIISLLLNHGANPDAANHWGITARIKSPGLFTHLEVSQITLPEPRIQNAEHLADHYHPRFKIPDRKERETLQPGQAVDLYVYGPKSDSKQDRVKARISARTGSGAGSRYVAIVETPLEQTHLPTGTGQIEFGPESVATVHLVRGVSGSKKKG